MSGYCPTHEWPHMKCDCQLCAQEEIAEYEATIERLKTALRLSREAMRPFAQAVKDRDLRPNDETMWNFGFKGLQLLAIKEVFETIDSLILSVGGSGKKEGQ